MPSSQCSAPTHLASVVAVAVPADAASGRDAYPLARRNQPQWLEIAAFLASQKFARSGVPGAAVIAAAAEGAPLAGEESADGAARVRPLPVGNHGENMDRFVTAAG